MSATEVWSTTVSVEPSTIAPDAIAPSQTVAQTFDVAAVTDLTTKAVDLAQTVSSLPLIG
ncbi:hypothetical protein [Alkalilimnicola sp. S0819]|uniref:hypothetical protein n=1 Tax=Alkalilimnicola sp. S0819 TaxID=2613922 RepID=UPI0012622E40|nr:hypothetical protein [Alkalilimnicola sp. S0819]KAB7627149.1 hypothetical protein F3N43_04340 [Alkalilimnicola sp. S0819]MPQ15858.1 hypothetical protein [Alkalilimnicola sp. S0819]